MGLLASKVVAITGAGAGIGRAVARLFASEGATLVLNDYGTDVDGKGHTPAVVEALGAELRATGAPITLHREDISTQGGAESLLRAALEEHSRLDVLVNCAGIVREQAVYNLRDRDFVAVLDVQVLGAFRCMQAAAIAMRTQGGGRIIHTTSTTALSGNFGQCVNSTAAAAIIGMTRAAAAELLRHRIYVNAVAPLAKTRQTEHLPLFQKGSGMTPEHAARAYLFLASDESKELSGEVLHVAGSRVTTLRVTESEPVYAQNADGLLSLDELALAPAKETHSR
jgi:NAD(P)-dependent dehydrogenase (short-subunit alcohol dehydrogenase family)